MSTALVKLIANWATTAERVALRTVSEIVGITAAAQPVANTISALKLAAKEASPTSMTRHRPRLPASEKKALNMIPASVSTDTVCTSRFFCS